MNFDFINLIQIMFLLISFTSIFYYVSYSYRYLKRKVQDNITKNIIIQWYKFIKKMLPADYRVYEKYDIWRYLARFKIEMMF